MHVELQAGLGAAPPDLIARANDYVYLLALRSSQPFSTLRVSTELEFLTPLNQFNVTRDIAIFRFLSLAIREQPPGIRSRVYKVTERCISRQHRLATNSDRTWHRICS